jgi:hypothetical protein
MTLKLEIDLENERVNFEGTWLGRAELAQRVQQKLATGDFHIAKLSEAIEQLGRTVSGARTLSLKLTQEQYAKLESAGARLGKSATEFARELLSQVLGSAVAASSTSPSLTPVSLTPVAAPPAAVTPPPVASYTPVSVPPVVAPVPGFVPAVTQPISMTPLMVSPVAPASVTEDEAAAALTITPKRKTEATMPPPVVSGTNTPKVVVDMGSTEKDMQPAQGGAPGDARRWFNRT